MSVSTDSGGNQKADQASRNEQMHYFPGWPLYYLFDKCNDANQAAYRERNYDVLSPLFSHETSPKRVRFLEPELGGLPSRDADFGWVIGHLADILVSTFAAK